MYVHPPPYPRLRPWKPMTIEERRDVFTLVLQSVHINFIERERERAEPILYPNVFRCMEILLCMPVSSAL